MVELLKNIPPQVVAFRASGEVTKDDYDNVIFPEVSKHVDQSFDLNYVFIIETELKNFTAAAWMSDAWLGLKNIAKWHKVAIVSDDDKICKFTDGASHFLPGEFKGFTKNEEDAAIAWAAL